METDGIPDLQEGMKRNRKIKYLNKCRRLFKKYLYLYLYIYVYLNISNLLLCIKLLPYFKARKRITLSTQLTQTLIKYNSVSDCPINCAIFYWLQASQKCCNTRWKGII